MMPYRKIKHRRFVIAARYQMSLHGPEVALPGAAYALQSGKGVDVAADIGIAGLWQRF